MTDKLITHEDARKSIGNIDYLSCHLMADYITQQEKKDKLFEQLYNVCKEYKHTSIGLSDDSEFLNVMSELEEKTHE